MGEQIRDRPEINQSSEGMAKEMGRGTDVCESLYAHAHIQRELRNQKAIEFMQGEVPPYPAITRKAAELVREGKVSDRLYQEAIKREQQLMQWREDHSSNVSEKSHEKSKQALEHVHKLYEKGLEKQKIIEDKQRREEHKTKQRAKPRLNS